MALVETKIYRDQWDVDLRLSQMGLSRAKLLAAVAVAMNERANATPFHPVNAAGTFAYQHGVWAIRNEFVGGMWVEDKTDGVEGIRNDTLKIKVAFSNVDLACRDDHIPKPRSTKGAGAERASNGAMLFADLPHYAPKPAEGLALYYLMVDESGAAELTRAVVKAGKFNDPIERIYLSKGGDEGDVLLTDNDDVANDFDPQVARR
ncbi:MAG: hypothetical protein E5V89_00960 [Mesorhizobium sp.]|uniref:hypothetical protein n=1 Tax=Mesorhizobium sp. WSM3866 TaxID=422271 RepID=UPI000BAF3282|nr:hypothetical protein [Mesorhizobium sp. WSM3866]PBB40614.1 hypothetical protein CK222_26740 [Mesorhizobium sp. WSM3866]TIV73295.1 MAG: hypothetical protein E5V89_00960 [Mesorhizobium sp.]